MNNNIFQEIDQLLSELSKMDNASKIARFFTAVKISTTFKA